MEIKTVSIIGLGALGILFGNNLSKKMPKENLRIIADKDRIKKYGILGLGKPEPLKHELFDYWSRRITDVHRLIYSIDEENIYIVSCKGHYHK